MTHQEFFDFLIDVYESGLYSTNVFFGYTVIRDPVGWVIISPCN